MSGITLWIMWAVILGALAAWLAVIAIAQRRPGFRRPTIDRRRGRVQGGTHTGGGRSVSPSRDAVAVPGEDPEGPSVADRPGPTRDEPGSPLDL